MNIFNITQYIDGIPEDKIRNELSNNSGVVFIDFEMSSINKSNSYLDLIQDHLEASFIAEELGKFSASIKAQLIDKYPYSPINRLEILVKDVDGFVKRICQLSIALYSGQEDDNVLIEYSEELNSYTDSLDDRLFLCPEIIDGYYANLVGAADLELESELEDGYLADEYKKYPEREYGFWKSAYSKTIGKDFYMSHDCWIIPPGVDIQRLITEYSDLSSEPPYDDSILIRLENEYYLVNRNGIVDFSMESFMQARNFVTSVLTKRFSDLILGEGLANSPIEESLKNHIAREWYSSNTHTRYLLSSSNLSIIVEDEYFRYVFYPNQLKGDKVTSLYDQVSALFGFVGEFAGVTKNIELSWKDFDDEKFEKLCYDIIYHDPRYDNRTIRKMGKSRSRDGGRDIVVFTKERPGKPKKMYIFQCKFTQANSSLTTQKVENISDTLVQYGAQGYGVMTTVVIDAALYDRLDEICKRFNIDSDNWSGLEIERFLARHPHLKERYFQS